MLVPKKYEDHKKVTTFEKEKVLWKSSDGIHKLVVAQTARPRSKAFPVVVAEYKNCATRIDYPWISAGKDGSVVAFDYPEVQPKYVKKIIENNAHQIVREVRKLIEEEPPE